ncbi:unnamed protein product [Oikopleura dioica]|uniref:Transmembrane protein n=1 Tax=Oikopleura dioica TaxID=34765 RepID=E4XYY7_OIKDI|nr:unnamed protein product [Oikopleura dioica]
MQLASQKSDLENKLLLLSNGERPFFRGPAFLHRMWLRQRQRKYEDELADTEHRIESWKDPKPSPCTGPSCLDIVLARFGGDAAFYGVVVFVVAAFLHYVGLLKPIWWIVSNFVWILKSVVYFLSNLHDLPVIGRFFSEPDPPTSLLDSVVDYLPGNITANVVGVYEVVEGSLTNLTDSAVDQVNGTIFKPVFAPVHPDVDPDAFFAVLNNVIVTLFSTENALWIEEQTQIAFDYLVDILFTAAKRVDVSVDDFTRPLARARRSFSMYDSGVDDYFELAANAEPFQRSDDPPAVKVSSKRSVSGFDAGVMHVQHVYPPPVAPQDDDNAQVGGAKPITWFCIVVLALLFLICCSGSCIKSSEDCFDLFAGLAKGTRDPVRDEARRQRREARFSQRQREKQLETDRKAEELRFTKAHNDAKLSKMAKPACSRDEDSECSVPSYGLLATTNLDNKTCPAADAPPAAKNVWDD